MRKADAAARRAEGRRPITPEEIPYLEAMGAELKALRTRIGITREALAFASFVSTYYVLLIENGFRRTRRSTLERITDALAQLASEDDLCWYRPKIELERLVHLAGPALAPESPWQERIIRRAHRRHQRRVDALTPWWKERTP